MLCGTKGRPLQLPGPGIPLDPGQKIRVKIGTSRPENILLVDDQPTADRGQASIRRGLLGTEVQNLRCVL